VRTVPSVRKMARTTPRKSVPNIAMPKRNAPANVRASTPAGGTTPSTWWNA
jgi:hypothetical protein